jgi:tripeptide aminopeptidase
MESVKNKFLRYIKICSTSDIKSEKSPSSKGQFELASMLKRELENMGLSNVRLDNNCYLTAEIPSNTEKEIPVIGFIAHLDTAPDMTAENVKPKITEKYDGGDIILNPEKNIILSPKDFKELSNYIGQTLITTDGTTLLGSDDKAGIAEIMTVVETILETENIKHGTIKIAFTPDEEIGRGADRFDVPKFGAKYAFTVDGGEIGELEYENFNAATAELEFNGRNVHPGTAKNQMINAARVAIELDQMLPGLERPETTEGYQGFFHLTNFSGDIENAKSTYLIRDHEKLKFEAKKKKIIDAANKLNEKYGKQTVTVAIKDNYQNMKEMIEPVFHIVNIAEKAMIDADIIPKIKPVRGGTDGARLSFMGLPCPNIFAGGHNFHGRYEYVSVQSMEKSVEVIINIIKGFCEDENFKNEI